MSPRGYSGGDAGGYYGGNVGGSYVSAYAGCWDAGAVVSEPKRGEVRFDNAESAQYAIDAMNGTVLHGSEIEVRKDMLCHDGARVLVSGLSPSTSWQDLKD